MRKDYLTRAIEQLESEIAVLELAKAKLLAQQHATAKKPKRPKPVVVAEKAG